MAAEKGSRSGEVRGVDQEMRDLHRRAHTMPEPNLSSDLSIDGCIVRRRIVPDEEIRFLGHQFLRGKRVVDIPDPTTLGDGGMYQDDQDE